MSFLSFFASLAKSLPVLLAISKKTNPQLINSNNSSFSQHFINYSLNHNLLNYVFGTWLLVFLESCCTNY